MIITKRITGLFRNLMPVFTIFFVAVVGRQIKSTPEPPDWFGTRFLGYKKSNVAVSCWNKWIVRVKNQRYPHCLKTASCKFFSTGGRRWRQVVTKYV